MRVYCWQALLSGICASALAVAGPPDAYPFTWSTVVNNGDYMPTALCDPTAPAPTAPPCRQFNSYNQPSVNANHVVVIRARSKGGQGGEPVHGVYARNMATAGPVVKILDRDTPVPEPNDLDTMFIEPPSFPRIDVWSDTMATRGNHKPVWEYLIGDTDERAGTSGIYTNPFGDLITGASKLGGIPEFSFFEVPEAPGTPFEVFPGAPAVTNGATIAFKGNYTVGGAAKTGVYYRNLLDVAIPSPEGSLEPAGGTNPVVLIANNTNTLIPGTKKRFGSTAPPSAAVTEQGKKGKPIAVFAGFDNEQNPKLGGIYLAPLTPYPLKKQPNLTTLVTIGGAVPGENYKAKFNKLGEGVSFDGRFVAFWGAWGSVTKTIVLRCPAEGNEDLVTYCNDQHPDGFPVQVPVHQGIFVHDTKTKQTHAVAKTPNDFDDFVYWNFSGRTPGTGEGDDDGELARWRSASFVAVSGLADGFLSQTEIYAPTFRIALKARTGKVVDGAYQNPVDGIYLRNTLGMIVTVVKTGMDGTLIDPEAASLPVTEMGLERDGFRGNALAINVSMGTEEAGWAGIYLTKIPK